MKVLANGGLNFSELDGWWAEAYKPDVGWAIGDGRDRGEDPDWDTAEAEALYSLLEGEIIPGFYTRDEGIPREWVARIRESMARLTPEFSTNRAVRQYVEEHYLRLASAYCGRAQNQGSAAADLLAWERRMAERWHEVRVGAVEVSNQDGQYSYRVEVGLGSIQPADVKVEIYAESLDGGPPFRAPMAWANSMEDPARGTHFYTAAVPADRPASDYTPRVVPQRNDVFVPLECALIEWQK
jgi:starch phosphorylase